MSAVCVIMDAKILILLQEILLKQYRYYTFFFKIYLLALQCVFEKLLRKAEDRLETKTD